MDAEPTVEGLRDTDAGTLTIGKFVSTNGSTDSPSNGASTVSLSTSAIGERDGFLLTGCFRFRSLRSVRDCDMWVGLNTTCGDAGWCIDFTESTSETLVFS